MSAQLRLKCDSCGTLMRSRDNETLMQLRDRAKRAGWRHDWKTNYEDHCQVCVAKVAK